MSATVLAHEATAGARLSDTVLLVGVAAAVCAGYLAGARRLPSGYRTWRAWGWRRWAFCAGVGVTVLAVLPPIDPVVDESFVLHMTQHLVLMFVAAPLLALGAPGLPLLLALPTRWRRRVAAVRSSGSGRRARAALTSPVLALVVFAVVVVAWHLPAVFTAALEHDSLHEAEHAFFLLAAWLLWLPLASPDRVLDGGRGTLYVFAGGFPMIGVGAALVMAPHPVYPAQTGTGPGALAAQQMAGVLMWVPPTFLSLFVIAALVLAWFRGMERTSPGDSPLPSTIPPELPGAGGTARRGGPVTARRRGAMLGIGGLAAALVVAACSTPGGHVPGAAPTLGDPDRGQRLISDYGCGSCHVVPGVHGADGLVGPPLTDFGRRSYIAGVLPNNADNLQHWIRDPQSVVPGNAMPDLGVSTVDARDIAAYLLTLG